jgi:hypothetical protein
MLERCKAARNAISQRGHDGAATRQFDPRKLIYSDILREVRAGGAGRDARACEVADS